MGDPLTGIAPAEFVDSFFVQERLPYELGWTPNLVPTTLATLAVLGAEILLFAGDAVPEGFEITESKFLLFH
jgi:hypothetical protein